MKKTCAYCGKDIYKRYGQNLLQWEVQKTHGECKSAYMRAETARLKAQQKPRRYFHRSYE